LRLSRGPLRWRLALLASAFMAHPKSVAEFRYCWICAGEFSDPWPHKTDRDVLQVDCATCGKYEITGPLYASKFPMDDSERYRMSYWNKMRTLEARELVSFTTHNIEAIVAALPNPATHSKPDLLLLTLTKLHTRASARFKLDTLRERSLACARDLNEFNFFLKYLVDRADLDFHHTQGYLIRPEGWERAARLASSDATTSKSAFVAMHFTKAMLDLWDSAFAPAIRRAGFEPRLANFPAHNEQIDARIVAEIRQCRFVVADVTGARTGVYFEAGYALGHGRPVIWTCREDAAKTDMHFDTRQYNHILWREAADLQEQLYLRIAATI
jgi:hypothetical protein